MAIKIDEDGQEYYSPDGEKLDPIVIPDSEFADDNAEFKEGESFEAEVDTAVAKQILADKIYTGWEASVRELYNNEITASHRARAMGDNARPIIHIVIDPIKRYFEITGHDSLGITPMVFRRRLAVMGRSGNLSDGNEIGQFGLGYASYKKMFNILHLTTWARGKKEDGSEFKPYTMLCEGGVNFTPTKPEAIETYGTKIHGIYKEGVDPDKIIKHVKDYARHQDVITWIHLLNDTREETAGEYRCFQYRDGYHYLMQKKADQLENNSNREQKPVFFRPIKIIRDDFDFFAWIGAYKSRWGNIDTDNISAEDCQIRLVNTPIIADLPYSISNAVSGYFLNIKDERKYPPTASRDSMEQGSIDSIAEEIKSELTKMYDEYRLADVKDYQARENKYPFSNYIWRMINHVLEDDMTDTILNTLHRSFTTHPDKRLFSIQQMMEKQTEKKKAGIDHKIVALKGLRADVMSKLDTVFRGDNKSCTYFRLPRDSYERSEERMKIFRALGVVFGEEYAREHRIKAQAKRRIATQRGEATDRSVRLYSHTGRSTQTEANQWGWGNYYETHTSHLLSEINDNAHPFIIKVKTSDWGNSLNATSRTDFLLVHDIKGFSNKIKTRDELFKELEDTMFEVNTEHMTFKELVDKQRKDKRTANKPKIVYCMYNDTEQDGRERNFTIHELGLNPDEYYLIAPVSRPKSVKRLMDILYWYNHTHDVNYTGTDDYKVAELLCDKLLVESPDKIEGDKVEKVSALLRMFRKCEAQNQMDIYNICKEALIHNYDNDTNKIMQLVDSSLERNE